MGDNNTSIPPDTMGVAGPNHLMVALNSQVLIQDRSGNTAEIVVGNEFTIDTTPPDEIPPEIREVRHDAADGVLKVGEKSSFSFKYYGKTPGIG